MARGTGSFWQRIRPLLRYFQPATYRTKPTPQPNTTTVNIPTAQPVTPAPVKETFGKLLLAQKVHMISEAGQRRMMLDMLYHGIWRMTEPYSYRDRGGTRLFYAFDHKDGHIKSFKLEDIEAMSVTNQPYEPKWPVEV